MPIKTVDYTLYTFNLRAKHEILELTDSNEPVYFTAVQEKEHISQREFAGT